MFLRSAVSVAWNLLMAEETSTSKGTQLMSRTLITLVLMWILPAAHGCAGGMNRGPASNGRDSGGGGVKADSGAQAPLTDSAPPLADKGAPVTKPDSSSPTTGCANGNLFAGYPWVKALCRPHPMPKPAPKAAEPPACVQKAMVALTSQADTYTDTGWTGDQIQGMDGDDTLKGMQCSDFINGNKGKDTVTGNMGNDRLHGGADDDALFGGAEHDELTGGGGNDSLTGGLGDDRFYFAEGAGYDTVMDGGGFDTIICAANSGRARARLMNWNRTGNDLLLFLSGGGLVRVKDHFASGSSAIDLILSCQ